MDKKDVQVNAVLPSVNVPLECVNVAVVMATFFVIVPVYPAFMLNVPPLQVPTLSMVQFLTDVPSNTIASVVTGTEIPPSHARTSDQLRSISADHVRVAIHST